MKLISVCIPTYEMYGLGEIFLRRSFDNLTKQIFKDFEIIISDHSQNKILEGLCGIYKQRLNIHYYRNTSNRGNSSANVNNAIKKATGRLIKILFEDDYIHTTKSLNLIASKFDLTKDRWLVTASAHSKDGQTIFKPFYATYNDEIYLGANTIGSPSVLTIRNYKPLLFDINLKWLMDCDYYKRCYDAFGQPKILNEILVVNQIGSHQVTNTIATESLKYKEYLYVLNKYDRGLRYWNLKLKKTKEYYRQKLSVRSWEVL